MVTQLQQFNLNASKFKLKQFGGPGSGPQKGGGSSKDANPRAATTYREKEAARIQALMDAEDAAFAEKNGLSVEPTTIDDVDVAFENSRQEDNFMRSADDAGVKAVMTNPNGPGGGNPVFKFTGPKYKVDKFLKKHGIHPDDN